jgi:hypothetical protein
MSPGHAPGVGLGKDPLGYRGPVDSVDHLDALSRAGLTSQLGDEAFDC